MHLNWLDWATIGGFILLSIGISLKYRKAAEKGLDSFFLGGRNLPWYLAGLSMVATTFAADTPLAVTELVAQGGIAKNWLWWNLLAGGLLTTIFFARLWRRSGVLTEIEFINIRYSGIGAPFLRGFKAFYLGVFINAMIIGWVNQALITLLQVFFDIPSSQVLWFVAGAMLLVMIYSGLSGLKGIAVTDAFQFIIAMIGCIVLAVLVLNSEKIGGMSGLRSKLPEGTLNFFPSIGAESALKGFGLSVATFLTYIGVLWWSCWYPGAEPGGGGYIAQRMMSTKNEKHSVYATLFFQIAHYCLRPWPWIIVALCAMVLYPNLEGAELKFGYVMAMKEFLPAGVKGLLLVAFLGAYMSTISTQLNWGASYVANDLYYPFMHKKDSAVKEITVARISTFIIAIVGLYITSLVETITGVWEFLFQCGAGLGLVLILRWFWHRINVWSEIAATVAPFAVYGFIYFKRSVFESQNSLLDQVQLSALKSDLWYYDFAYGVLLSVGITTIVWLIVTYITPPTDPEKMQKFFDRIRPQGNWKPYGATDNSSIKYLLVAWLAAVVMVYGALFTTGKIILFGWQTSLLYFAVTILSFFIFRWGAVKGKLFVD
jgi:Na+/proline symporter